MTEPKKCLYVARGYLIDPKERKITHVHHDTRHYQEIYKLIDCEPSPFTVVELPNRDVIFVDDEGLLKEPRYFFTIKGYPQPLAGKGLVLGTGPDGQTVSAKMSFQELGEMVGYVELSVRGWQEVEGKMDHPLLGKDTPYFGSQPIFGPPTTEDETNDA
jgi:hypothetical protein